MPVQSSFGEEFPEERSPNGVVSFDDVQEDKQWFRSVLKVHTITGFRNDVCTVNSAAVV